MASRARSQLPVTLGLVALLAGLGVCSVEVILTLHHHQKARRDLAELQDVSHGLLDPNAWIEQVSGIIERKIQAFQFTPEIRSEVKPILERMLDAFITKADEQMRKQRDAKNLGVRLKEDIREKLISADTLKAGIPADADAILDEMAKPSTRRDIKRVLRHALNTVSRETSSPSTRASDARVEAIHRAYGCSDQTSCEEKLKVELHAGRHIALMWTVATLTVALLLFIGVGWATRRRSNGDRHRGYLAMLIAACSMLLACGILTPMLDVEARISHLSLLLLGEKVQFTDQVLYFQSKSVLDVVRVLTSTGKIDMIAVGLALVTFSVIFPLLKLTASTIYLYDLGGLRKRSLVKFFALKSSKWSMADVFVVAIFMAYIGFSGIVDSELKAFGQAAAPDVSVLTTNGSSLQLGYFLFLGFCIAGLATSSLLGAAIETSEESPSRRGGSAPPGPRRLPTPSSPPLPAPGRNPFRPGREDPTHPG